MQGFFMHPNKNIRIKSLVLAPFFSHEATSNRPLLVSEVLLRFGKVDIVTTSFDHQAKVVKKELQFNDGRTIHCLPTVPYRHNVSPVRFLSHFLFSLRAWLFYLKRRNEYGVIYATLPLNLIAVLVFLTSPGKIRIADVVDIWPDVLPFQAIVKKIFFPFFAIWKKSFALAVNHCDILLTVSDQFMDESIPFFRHERSAAQRFYIGATRLPRKTKQGDSPLTILYIGNIGRLYDFETLLTSMQACRDKLRFFIVGEGDRKDWLLSELKRMKIEHHYFGVVYDDYNLGEILSSCDVGFNGYRNTSAAFSYKANTYFSSGLPILNSMNGDLKDLVATHGLGFNYTACDAASLLTCINSCSREALSVLSQNVVRFFESDIEHGRIKDDLTDFVGRFIDRPGVT
jgi:hypothetical protein